MGGGEVDQRLLGLGGSVGRGGVQVAGAPAGVSVEQAQVVADFVGDEVAVVGRVPVARVGERDVLHVVGGEGDDGRHRLAGVGRVGVAPADGSGAHAVAEEDHDLARITGGDLVAVDPPVGAGVVLVVELGVVAGLPVPGGIEDQFHVGVGEGLVGPGDALGEVVEGERVLPLAVVVRQRYGVDAQLLHRTPFCGCLPAGPPDKILR